MTGRPPIWNRILFVSAGICLLGGSVSPARADIKIAFVNSELILEQSKEAKAALESFNRDVEGWNQEALTRRKELDNLAQELSQQAPMLSDEKRLEKEQDHQRKLTEYDQLLQSVWGPGGLVVKRNEEVLRPIITKIQNLLSRIGGDEGFDLILDAADGNVLYADKALDLTQRVIDLLNSEQP